LSALCGDDWFSDNLPNKLHEKDASQHLSGKWIIEIGELSQMKSNEVEEIKLFVSRKIDKYRPSYGRRDCSFPRQCVFAASTNSDEFLRDETGNRRFWVAPINTVDVRGIAENRDQIWAEAVQMLRDGEKWWCSEPWFIEAQENSSSNYMILDPWHEQIRNYVKNKERVFVNDVLLEVCRVSDTWTKNHRDRVCSTLRKLKFVRKRIKDNGGYFFTPAKATDREDEEED
jgi:predicted P-loop ATPase